MGDSERKDKDIEVLAILPAPAGLTVERLAGKPLLAHAVEHAQAAQLVTRAVVVTDDAPVAALSGQYGVTAVRCPPESWRDTASESAALHVLDHLRASEGYEPELVVFLECTAPLTSPEDVDNTIEALLGEDADSAVAVTPFKRSIWRREGDDVVGVLRARKGEPRYLETGAIHAARARGFREAKQRVFGKVALSPMAPERSLEILAPLDLRIAEIRLRELHERRRSEALPDPIGALVLDFDGVFTDNRVLVFQDGREGVLCNRSDGWGLGQLKKLRVPILVLSTEKNPVVRARCDKLGLACLHGVEDKVAELERWLEERHIQLAQVVYAGNDLNDLACLEAVGCGVAVSDAYPEVKAAARIVLAAPGGYGAVRELVDLIQDKLKA